MTIFGTATRVTKMSFPDEEYLDDADTSHNPRTNYEGEDTSPTTDRELKGWYAYPIAAEVYAVVAVGMTFFHLLHTTRTVLYQQIKQERFYQ
jgi:hypothetical protein